MQQQVTETLQSALPFGQRAHYLRVITDEGRIDARHFQELPDKLIKQPGGGPGWRALDIFCHTDIKDSASFFRFEEVRFWQLHAQGFLKLFYHADFPEGRGEVNLIGLAFWAIWMVGDLVTACNVFYHPWERNVSFKEDQEQVQLKAAHQSSRHVGKTKGAGGGVT